MLVFDDVVLALQLPKDPNTSAALLRMGATHAADPGGLPKSLRIVFLSPTPHRTVPAPTVSLIPLYLAPYRSLRTVRSVPLTPYRSLLVILSMPSVLLAIAAFFLLVT